ncbi:MAG: Uma2 family endonuclease [Acidobacteria bacterium]|nr:Uma2 family endonuclease [Acidobacteriota bacterium]
MPLASPATAASLASQDAVDVLLREVLPPQGGWSDEEYLWLTDRARRRIELTDGGLELLPMPTRAHQILLLFLYRVFHAHLQEAARPGLVITSGLRMRVRSGKFREPDLLLLLDRSDPRNEDRFWLGADLVAEVVSPDDPPRDLVVKRADYAEARIPEYWIVDPRCETVTVLKLAGSDYVEHGMFARGDTATSALLDGVAVGVTALFDEAAE